MAYRPKFDPEPLGLKPNFRLTKFSGLHGGGCKMPIDALNKLLDELGPNQYQDENQHDQLGGMMTPRLGIGLDSCVVPLRFGGLSLIQTTDFFYPLVDDPYMMGKIACANVVSDLYAMGVTECDNMLMLLGVSSKFSNQERDTIVPLMMRGFKDAAEEAGTTVTGGQTVLNPWCIIGGAATTVCQCNEYIMPDNAVPGDVLVLTKPLGTQVACNAHQWLEQVPEKWNRIKLIVSEEDIEKAYQDAMFNMARLNRVAAQLMHTYMAHGATDITGFGILGHAKNLAKQQKNEVNFVIHNLPCIAKMANIAKACGNLFGLLQGTSAETSGGLLICLPREQAAKYCAEIKKVEGHQAWIIGIVEPGDRSARVIDKPRVIEVQTLEDGTVQSVPPVTTPRRTSHVKVAPPPVEEKKEILSNQISNNNHCQQQPQQIEMQQVPDMGGEPVVLQAVPVSQEELQEQQINHITTTDASQLEQVIVQDGQHYQEIQTTEYQQ